MKRPRDDIPSKMPVDRKAFLLTPGKFTEELTLRVNNRIVFENQHKKSTQDHGNWHEFITTDHTKMLVLTFHHSGSESDLWPHLFKCFVPGVYRMQNQSQVVVFPEEFKDQITKEPLRLDLPEKDRGFQVENVYLWFHPERVPAVLLITPEKKIVYHEIKEGAKRRRTCTSVPNGSFVCNDSDTITTRFHWKGEATTQQTVLNRICANVPVYRASGDGVSPSFANPVDLKAWHIVSVNLDVDKVRINYTPDNEAS